LVIALCMIPQLAWSKPKRGSKPDKDTKPPVITHARISKATIGLPIIIRAKIEDESEIFAPAVYLRAQGKPDFESFPMKKSGDGFEAVIPAELTKSSVEYFIEAFDDQGNGPSREGSPEDPIKVAVFDPSKVELSADKTEAQTTVTAKDDGSSSLRETTQATRSKDGDDAGLQTKWWFWTLIGVAVTGAIAATVVVLQSQGRVDTVDVQVHGPNPAAGL
jgi:hypothetical protein